MVSSTWRTSEDVQPPKGLIGPNAILQLLPLIETLEGPSRVAQMLEGAGLVDVPDGNSMIPEGDVARLHRHLRLKEPKRAAVLSAEAGVRTADYILAHRIPKPVQLGLKALPARVAVRLLSTAIRRHAWTFVGSGQFHVRNPWAFEIVDNPLIRGETSDTCLCDWHGSVFARLYQSLVSPRCRCKETQCGAKDAGKTCRFELWRE